MLALFEVHVTPGVDVTQLFSAEVLSDTAAEIMTVAQAKAVGFGGLNALGDDSNIYLVAVSGKDVNFISSRLEASSAVTRFRLHHVGD